MKCSECSGDSAILVKVRKDGWEGEICPLCLLGSRNELLVSIDKEASKASPERTVFQGPALGGSRGNEDFFDLDPHEVIPFRGYGAWTPPPSYLTGYVSSSSLPDVRGVPSPFPSLTLSCSFTFDDIDTLVEKAKEKWGEDRLGLGGRKIFEHSFEQDLIHEQESREQPMLDDEGRKKYAQAEARLDELIAETRERLKQVDFEHIKNFDSPDTTGLRLETKGSG
jgi:hypothetical protein